MLERLASAGDRLLTRLVPRATASAVVCWYEYLPISSPCYRRYCCTGSGIPGGSYCTGYSAC
ncbi:hypothetical protein SUDANB121_05646 [Nocardiopsis dassonvillei]|uniref:hypothetical protein n=1 Tax=Nocardiopsis dassonvillei TaxID=2014 RepID=UPI003F56F5C7